MEKEFGNHNRKEIAFRINGAVYLIDAFLTMHKSQKYDVTFRIEHNYKKAIASIVYDKICAKYENAKVTIEDLQSADDGIYYEFLNTIIDSNKELKKIFDETEENQSIVNRFGQAYEAYIINLIKRVEEALQPLVNYQKQIVQGIDFSGLNRSSEIIKKWANSRGKVVYNMNQNAMKIANIMQPLKAIADKISESLSKISIPRITNEEISEWKHNYKKWGELGWPVIPHAHYNFFNSFPHDVSTANKLAMKYCNKEAMEVSFENLRKEKMKKTDLESAIFCYQNRQYKACALLLFGIIDSVLIKKQPRSKDVKVGLGAIKVIKQGLSEKTDDEKFLMTSLYQINIFTCLDVFFARAGGFLSEPDTINRNFVNHGMESRNVRKRDCVQLFILIEDLLVLMK